MSVMRDAGEERWRQRSACLGCDPDLFYPARGANQQREEALAICAVCPVREECLEAHLFEEEGVFGGTTARVRKKIRIARHRASGGLVAKKCRQCGADFQGFHQQWTCSQECRLIRKRERTKRSKMKGQTR